MPKKAILTKEAICEAAELRAQGWTNDQIASKLGVSATRIGQVLGPHSKKRRSSSALPRLASTFRSAHVTGHLRPRK